MAGIKRHGKIWAATFLIRLVDRLIDALLMRADGRHQMAACRKAQHPDLVRVYAPVGSMMADQAHGTLRILQRSVYLGSDADVTDRVPVRARSGHAVFQ